MRNLWTVKTRLGRGDGEYRKCAGEGLRNASVQILDRRSVSL